MPDFHLAFTLRTVLLIAAIPVSLLFAFWSYRYTVPPISKSLKTVLASLRALALFFLFILLGEPLLSLFTHSIQEPVVAVLIDNSKSMAIRERAGDRKQILIKTLTSSSFAKLQDIGVPHYFLFDRASRPLSSFSPESVTTSGDATDIGAALKHLKDAAGTQNIQAVIMLTDGEFTVGTSPLYEAQELGLPIFTVGIGDSSEQQDVQIRRVLANDITYLGNRVPVNATIRSTGFRGERTEVTLQQDGRILDRKVLLLEQGTREYAIPLSFVPAKEGIQKFTVAVSTLPGELTDRNNAMSFFTKVLKSKMKVVFVAGSPSQDVAFLRRSLEGDKNVDLHPFIEEKNGDFYNTPMTAQAIADADCLVLVDYPNDVTSAASFALIREAVTGTKPFMFVLSRTVNFEKLRALEAALPFRLGETSTNEYQVFASIPAAEVDNPILRLSSGSVDVWSKLAPLFSLQASFSAKPESEVLGTIRLQTTTTTEPLLVSRNVNRRKSFAILAYGLWRWKMYGEPGNGTENVLDEFLSNTVRWLTTRDDDRRFRIQPAKAMFSGQEPVEFTGQVYDENYKPVEDATVQVTITQDRHTNDIVLNSLGSGQYDGYLEGLAEGDYSFTSTASQNGRVIGADKGKFSVGGLNVEFLDTRMNKLLLQQLAAQTGGKYYDPVAMDDLPKDIASLSNFKPTELTQTNEIELWNLKWTLSLIILLFSVEWFLRKRSGMI